MVQRFVMPRQSAFLDNGLAGAGWKLDFFATGTAVRQDTFSDVALTIANANPVIADSAGRFGDIFLQNLNYKVELSDAADVMKWSSDPVTGGFVESAIDIEFNIQDDGALGDDSTDNATFINTTIARAVAAGGSIFIPRGTYRYGSSLDIDGNNLRFRGEGRLSILKATAAGAHFGHPATKPTRTLMTSNANAGDITVTLSTGGGASFTVGQFLGLESQDAGFGLVAATNRAAEEHKVMLITGDVLTLDSPLIFNYTTGNSADWYNASDDILTDCEIRDLAFTTLDSSTTSVRTLNLRSFHRLKLDNIWVFDAGGGILMEGCHDVQTTNIHVENLFHLGDSFGYGIMVIGQSSNVEITNYIARDTRHAFTTLSREDTGNFYGGPRDVTVNNGHGMNSDAVREAVQALSIWDTHAYGQNIQFNGCTGHQGGNVNQAIQIRGRDVSVTGGYFTSRGPRTIDITSESLGTILNGPTLRNVSIVTPGSAINISGQLDSVVAINNLIILESGDRGIDISSTNPKVIITGGSISGVVADPVRFSANTKSHMNGTRIEKGSTSLVGVENVGAGSTVTGCHFTGGFLALNIFNNSAGVGFSGNFLEGQPLNEGGQIDITASGFTVDPGVRGALVTNAGTAGVLVFALPPAIPGMKFSFQRVATFSLSFNPDGTEVFRGEAAGEQLNLVSDNTRADIWCTVAGTWEFQIYQGSAFAVVTTDFTFTA